jgi:hypothetical protein
LITQQTLACALGKIDAVNLADPNREIVNGEALPKEFAYSQHMTRWLFELAPQPSPRMQIACWARHIKRWTLRRSDFPEGRKAYDPSTLASRLVAASFSQLDHSSLLLLRK